MSDIGIIFSPQDIALMIAVACSPGLLLGALYGAWLSRAHRWRGATLGGVIGFVLAGVGWWVYLDVVKLRHQTLVAGHANQARLPASLVSSPYAYINNDARKSVEKPPPY